MHAENFRSRMVCEAAICLRGDCIGNSRNASAEHFRRRGHSGRQEGSCAPARQRGGHHFERLWRPSHHVLAPRAVDVHIHKAGRRGSVEHFHQARAARYGDRFARTHGQDATLFEQNYGVGNFFCRRDRAIYENGSQGHRRSHPTRSKAEGARRETASSKKKGRTEVLPGDPAKGVGTNYIPAALIESTAILSPSIEPFTLTFWPAYFAASSCLSST